MLLAVGLPASLSSCLAFATSPSASSACRTGRSPSRSRDRRGRSGRWRSRRRAGAAVELVDLRARQGVGDGLADLLVLHPVRLKYQLPDVRRVALDRARLGRLASPDDLAAGARRRPVGEACTGSGPRRVSAIRRLGLVSRRCWSNSMLKPSTYWWRIGSVFGSQFGFLTSSIDLPGLESGSCTGPLDTGFLSYFSLVSFSLGTMRVAGHGEGVRQVGLRRLELEDDRLVVRRASTDVRAGACRCTGPPAAPSCGPAPDSHCWM